MMVVKAHLLPSLIGLKPFFSLLSYFLSYIYLSSCMYPSHQLYPSRHFGFVFFLSLTYRSSSSSLTYRHGIRATLEGEIDLPCCICLPCRRFFALLPAVPLFRRRAAATCHRPNAISRRPDAIPPGRYSASPRPDAIPATSSGRRCSALTPERPDAALTPLLTPVFAAFAALS